MSDEDRFGKAKADIEAKRKALEAELEQSMLDAKTPASMSTNEAIAQGIIGILPMLLGNAIAKKRGMAAGAKSGLAASQQYEKSVKEKGLLAQENAKAKAKALLSQISGVDKAGTSLDIAGVKADAAGDAADTRFGREKELQSIRHQDSLDRMRQSKAIPQAKAEAGGLIDEARAFLRAKVAAGETLEPDERRAAHMDPMLSKLLLTAALKKGAGGDISEMEANVRAKIANGQKLEPEEERFAHTDKDLSKALISAGLSRQNAAATQDQRQEDAKELQDLRFGQSKELKGIPSAKAVEAPQEGEQAELRAAILTGAEMTPELIARIAKYPGLAAELRQKQGQGARGRANKETYDRAVSERQIPGVQFVAGYTPTKDDTDRAQKLLSARGSIKQYSDKYVQALKVGNVSDQASALANLVWTGKDIRAAGASFTDSEQMLIRAGLPPTGELDWTYAGAKDYFTKQMQNTDNSAKIAAFVKDMNEEIDRGMITHKYTPPGYTSQIVNVEGKRRSVIFKDGKYFQHFELQ